VLSAEPLTNGSNPNLDAISFLRYEKWRDDELVATELQRFRLQYWSLPEFGPRDSWARPAIVTTWMPQPCCSIDVDGASTP
jgi:hypothetical protein